MKNNSKCLTQSFFKPLLSVFTLILVSFSISACSTTAPKRTIYSGPDSVTAADASALVGNWSGRILNPLEGEQVDSVRYLFDADGTWTGSAVSTSSGMDIEMQSVGTWSAEGDYYNIMVDNIEVVSDNPAVKLMSGIMTASAKKQAGRSNPYEVSPNRIVLVSEHQQALELTRE